MRRTLLLLTALLGALLGDETLARGADQHLLRGQATRVEGVWHLRVTEGDSKVPKGVLRLEGLDAVKSVPLHERQFLEVRGSVYGPGKGCVGRYLCLRVNSLAPAAPQPLKPEDLRLPDVP